MMSLNATVMSSELADVISQSDCIIKNSYIQKWMVWRIKESIMGVRAREKKNVPRNHNLASLGKPRDAREWSSGQFFLSTPHINGRSFISTLTPLIDYFLLTSKPVIINGRNDVISTICICWFVKPLRKMVLLYAWWLVWALLMKHHFEFDRYRRWRGRLYSAVAILTFASFPALKQLCSNHVCSNRVLRKRSFNCRMTCQVKTNKFVWTSISMMHLEGFFTDYTGPPPVKSGFYVKLCVSAQHNRTILCSRRVFDSTDPDQTPWISFVCIVAISITEYLNHIAWHT